MNMKNGLRIMQFVVIISLLAWTTLKNIHVSNAFSYIAIAGGTAIIIFLLYIAQKMVNKIQTKKGKLILYALALISSIIMVLSLNLSIIPQYNNVILTIQCGEKNDASKSSEMWLLKWIKNGVEQDASVLPIEQINNVEFRKERGQYVYYDHEDIGSGYMTLCLDGSDNNQLVFLRHEYSGIIKISTNVNDQIETIDLYGKNDDATPYAYDVPKGTATGVLEKSIISIGYIVSFDVVFELIWACLFIASARIGRTLRNKTRLQQINNYRLSSAWIKSIMQWIVKNWLKLSQLVIIVSLLAWNILSDSNRSNVFSYIAIAGGAAITIYFLQLIQIMINKIKTSKGKMLLYILAFLSSIVMIASLNSSIIPQYNDVILTIQCGEKNDVSQNSEMWLLRWMKNGIEQDASTLPIEQISNIEFRREQGQYVYYDHERTGSGYMTLHFKGGDENQLVFHRHGHSGIIKISTNVNDQVEAIDLYGENNVNTPYKYDVPKGSATGIIKKSAIVIGYMTLIFAAFELIWAYLFNAFAGIIRIIRGQVKLKRICSTNFFFSLIASALLPIVYLLFQFTQNSTEISFTLLLVLCGITALFSLLIFLLIYVATASSIISYLTNMLFNIYLFATGYILVALSSTSLTGANFSYQAHLITAGFCCTGMFILLLCKKKLPDSSMFSIIATVFTALLLVFNLTPSLELWRQQNIGNNQEYVKTDFKIGTQNAGEKPNVYWIHCDGMLGFESFEKYFGDDQAQFKESLTERGFVLNENATLLAGHSTTSCVPALMCPEFFDRYLSGLLAGATSEDARTLIAETDVQKLLSIEQENNEVTNAFDQAGYTTYTVASAYWSIYPRITDYYYLMDSKGVLQESIDVNSAKAKSGSLMSNEIEKMHIFMDQLTYPLSSLILSVLPQGYNTIVAMLEDSTYVVRRVFEGVDSDPIHCKATQALDQMLMYRTSDEANFAILIYDQTHRPFVYDENGNKIYTSNENPIDYAPQHRYMQKVLLKAIDTILAQDPDAVIVLQADHGLHGNTRDDFLKAFGDADEGELWDQVMSAIRVPERYKNGDEEYAYTNPLNISRYLVNRFVGQNYEYLPANITIN